MEEDRKSVYVESTIPSYATARPSRDMITAAHQTITKLFWEQERYKYDLFISDYVLDEIRDGDPEAAQKRLDCVAGITVLQESAEIETLAVIYQKLLGIPDRAKADCSHLATCVAQHIDYLLTWNCTHLGPASQKTVQHYNEQHGLWVPILVTPETLMPNGIQEEKLI